MRSLFQQDAPPMTRFVRVVVERGIEQPLIADDEGLTYGVPEGASLADVAGVGQRVRVPLGQSGKLVAGWVVREGGPELLAGLHEDRVKPIASADPIRLAPQLLDLARWMAQYYVCPLGMVLGTLTPGAVKAGTGRAKVQLIRLARPSPGTQGEGPPKLSKKSRALWEALRAAGAVGEGGEGGEGGEVEVKQLARSLGLASIAPIRRLIQAGLLESRIQERVLARTLDGLGDHASRDTSPGAEVVALPTPTPEQHVCIDAITQSLGSFRAHLLRGVTGSGKTEVYLRCIDALLQREPRGGVVVLVPEIALTPQTMSRFVARLGQQRVAVLHSGLTSAQRNKEWMRVAMGEARIVVGARSAIFAPLSRVDLIIVDEEHDQSYKQDQLPRYHARDVAIKRAHLARCPVVLGSATPSMESWHNALPASAGGAGRFNLLTMRTRATGALLPSVRIVDLRDQRRLREQSPLHNPRERHLLGPTLETAIEECLELGHQVILLHNRRGLAHHLACPSGPCKFVVGCERCSASLVLHTDPRAPAGQIVRCHHCLTEQRVPSLCPTCGKRLISLGGGTQALEAEVERKFASMGIKRDPQQTNAGTLLRLDSDTMTIARDYFDALSRFASGEARVMVGTQMIAKGLDFPGVRLVGIVDADTALQVPDFRASERTFQLVSQAAGRAGRGGRGGRGGSGQGEQVAGQVIVQSNAPNASAIQHACRHDYEAFARDELEARRMFLFPPATRMARIVCRDLVAEKARSRAEAIAGALDEARGETDEFRVVGPAPCQIERIADYFRVGVEIFAPDAPTLQRALARARAKGLVKSDAKTAVDVDPVSVL